MKRFLQISTVFFVLLFISNVSVAKPRCNGSLYKITWTNCEGTRTYSDGDKYIGEFKDGEYSGQGTFTFANGDSLVGEFKVGRFINGRATLTTDGRKYVHWYKNGEKIKY